MRIIILGMCTMIAAGVFAAMVCAVCTHRRNSYPPHFHSRVVVELIWAAIPCVMLVACAFPAAKLIIASPDRQADPPRTVQ
jgi:cytochrome c oxidase subunit 2